MTKAEQDAEHEMRLAIRVWLQCPESKRPSAAALGDLVAKIASSHSEQAKLEAKRETEVRA
jgi:hypothetical protein